MRISGCAKHISEWRKCFQAIWLSLPGVVLCLSQEGTLLFPVYSMVLHVKQPYAQRLYILLYELGLYQCREKRTMAMQDSFGKKLIRLK